MNLLSARQSYLSHISTNGCLALTCLVWGLLSSTSLQGANIISIEEQWELSVGQPIPSRSSPQTSMIMSPQYDLSGTYFLFTINHKTLPAFTSGGMQVQQWSGNSPQATHNGPQEGSISSENEVVRWSQRLKIENGTISFEVVDGTSQTWNNFGGQGYLKVSSSTGLENLNGYRTYNSLTESEVGYAGNRVEALVLKKLIWVTDDGVVRELEAPIAIDTELDP